MRIDFQGQLLQSSKLFVGKALSNCGIDLSFKHIQTIITRVIIGELAKVKGFFPMSLDVMDSLCHVPCFSRSALGHLQTQTKLQTCSFPENPNMKKLRKQNAS